MARYDKYDPISGGFRAKLAETLTTDPVSGEFGPVAVSLDSAGHVVIGTAGQSGLVGVLVKNAPKQGLGRWPTTTNGVPNPAAPIGALAGDVVDIMTSGEIVDVDPALLPGTAVYTDAAGDLSGTAGGTKVGYIVESGRMVVRVAA
jgi:hypothetical protein